MSATDWLISATQLLLTTLVGALIFFYVQTRRRYQYWKKLGVQQVEPVFPIGNLSKSAFGARSTYLRLQDLYTIFKKQNLSYGGIYFYNGPVFMVVSIDFVKRVLLTDFEYFSERGVYVDEERLPITAHLSSMKGDPWRDLRRKFTPMFSSGKLKRMHPIIMKNIQNLVNILKTCEDGTEFDIKQKFMCLTTDIVGSVAFGLECNCLQNPDQEFNAMVHRIFNATLWDLFSLVLNEGLQNPGNILRTAYNSKVTKFFTDLVHKTVDYRDKNNVDRDDFMNLLLKMRDTVGMSMNEIVAQSYLFFIAGFETTSSTLSCAMHELAWDQDLQNRLRKEVIDTLGKDISKYNYEGVMGLPLLDKILKETLRKHPPIGIMTRLVVKPYRIPDTNIVLERRLPVIISILAIHRDPEYFPDPMKFDPERFSSKNADKLVPYTFLGFGEGPRNCIGTRLALVNMKLTVAALISNFKFEPAKDAKYDLPINPSTTAIVLTIKGGVNLKLTKL